MQICARFPICQNIIGEVHYQAPVSHEENLNLHASS